MVWSFFINPIVASGISLGSLIRPGTNPSAVPFRWAEYCPSDERGQHRNYSRWLYRTPPYPYWSPADTPRLKEPPGATDSTPFGRIGGNIREETTVIYMCRLSRDRIAKLTPPLVWSFFINPIVASGIGAGSHLDPKPTHPQYPSVERSTPLPMSGGNTLTTVAGSTGLVEQSVNVG